MNATHSVFLPEQGDKATREAGERYGAGCDGVRGAANRSRLGGRACSFYMMWRPKRQARSWMSYFQLLTMSALRFCPVNNSVIVPFFFFKCRCDMFYTQGRRFRAIIATNVPSQV